MENTKRKERFMKHTKKFISMLLIVCMLGLTVFSNIGTLGTDAVVSAADETAAMKKLTFDDFGIEDGEYSKTPSYHTAKHLAAKTAFKNSVFSGKLMFPKPESGARTKTTRVVFGSTNGWEGFFFSVNPAGTIMQFDISTVVESGASKTGFQIRTDQGSHNNWIGSFVDKEFKLEISFEALDYDGDGSEDDAKVKVYINDKQCELFCSSDSKFYNEWYIQGAYTKGNLTNNIYFQNADANNTVKVSSSAKEKLRQISFKDLGYEDNTEYTSKSQYYNYSLRNTIISSKIQIEATTYLIYGVAGWTGLQIVKDAEGHFTVKWGGTSGAAYGTSFDFSEPEGVDFESQFTFSITTEVFDCEGNGVLDDAKIGLWANGRLLGNQYVGIKDMFKDEDISAGDFYVDGKVTFETIPYTLSDELNRLTVDDFGLNLGMYSSSAKKKSFGYTDASQLPTTVMDTVLSVDVEVSGDESWIRYATGQEYEEDGLCLRFNRGDVLYVQFWKQSSEASAWLSQATITPQDAGLTTFRDKEFHLDISLVRCDLDGDDRNNDVQLGLWFNGNLAKNQYYYIKDKADAIPTGMGLITSYWTNGVSTLKLDYEPEVLSEKLRKLTLNEFGLATGEYTSSSQTDKFGQKKPSSLLNTVVSLDVEVSGRESWLQYAANRNSYWWDGLMLRFNASDVVYVDFWEQSDGTEWLPQAAITPQDAGLTTFRNQKFKLQISLEKWDVDGDGENNDVRIGLWFNGNLAKNQYYYVKDKASSIPTGMGLFTSRWSDGESTIKLASSTQTHETFDELTLDSFGMTPAICGYGKANNPYHLDVSRSNTVETLDDKIFSTNVRFNSYDSDIYYARRNNNNWDAIRIGNATDNELKGNKQARCFRLTNSNGKISKIFDEAIAGIRLSNDTFNLKISTRNVDSDGDGAFDDLELGVWFNNKLYNNAYMYYAEMADVYEPYVGTYCSTGRGEVVLGDVVQTEATPITYCADEFAYFVDGDTVTVDSVDCGTSKTLSAPGVYDVTYTDLDSTYMEKVTVYKTNDITENGDVDVRDLVALKKYIADRREINAAGEQAIGAGQGFDGATAYDKMVEHLLGDSNVIGAKEFSEELVGTQTGAGTYVAAVDTTEKGTSVMSFTETQTDNYKSNADTFDSMGLDYVLDFATDRDIKVLQITDTQLVDSTQDTTNLTAEKIEAYKPTDENKAKLLYNELDQLVAETKPDVILLTGDIVWGTYDDAGTLFEDIVAHMDSYKIPWAPIMGNHDQETAKGTAWICDLLRSAKYCMFTRNNELGGNGNYSIGIAKNGELERTIFMMDSSGIYGASEEEIASGEANYVYMLHEGQIAWYRTVADRTKVKSFVCMHADSADFVTAMQEKGYQSMVDNTYNKAYYDLGMDNTQEDFGFKYEAITEGGMKMDEYLYPYFQAAGTDGVFIGHRHNNSLSIKWKDIRWTYGLKTGRYASYWKKTGGTLIILDGSDFVVEYKVITDTSVAQ